MVSYYYFFVFSSPILSGRRLAVYHTFTHDVAYREFRMQVWNVVHPARWKYRTQKIATYAPSHNFLGLYLRIDIRKNFLNSSISCTCSDNMVNFGPLAAEIGLPVWGTPENFNGFRVLASLLHRRRSTEVNQTLHDVWPYPELVYYV